MSLFKKILGKLGIKKDAEEVTPAPKKEKPSSKGPTEAPRQPVAKPRRTTSTSPRRPVADKERKFSRPAASSAQASVPRVDVTSKLETMAKGTNLDWKVSIVDLLKVLGIESSLSARKELATELGCPPEVMGGDSAKMNIWLHKTVLKKIAENGGNIPQELLD